MFQRKLLSLSLLALFSLLFSAPQQALAGGFAILEQSSDGVGYAFAGAAAGYGDGSEIAFNPAAMSWIEETTLHHSSHLIIPKSEFTNQGSSNPMIGIPLSGSDGPNGGETVYVPSFYFVHPYNDKLHIGFGIHTPFGLATDYDRNWVGRYEAVKSELTTINLTPAVSYKVSDNFSIGAALHVLYADATLNNAIDFGTIGVAQLGAPTATLLGLSPQGNDGFGEVSGDDWTTGFSLGGSYRYGNDSRIGLSWHPRMQLDLRGDAKFEVPTAALPLTATGFFTDSSARVQTDLPESIQFGWIHNFCDTYGILYESAWTRWSRFDELRVQFGNGQPDSVKDESWENVWRHSIAFRYSPSEALDLSIGFAFDEEPIPGADHRTPRIPGNDRRWLAFGVKYSATEDLTLGASYAHLFVSDPMINAFDSVGNNLKGEIDAEVDIVSLSATYIF